MPDPRIHSVFRFENGMVAVTDGEEQIPEYQGPFEEVHEKIEAAAPPTAYWYNWPDKPDGPRR